MAYGEECPTVRFRGRLLFWATVAIGVFYSLVLWNLQIVRVEEFRGRSERNAVRSQPIKAGRGIIVDRRGAILARNRRSFDLLVDPMDLGSEERERIQDILAKRLGLEAEEIETKIENAGPAKRPVLIAEDVDFRTIAWVEAHRLEYPHLRVRPAHRREYPWDSVGAHLLGYIGEITKRELEQTQLSDHRPGDLVGKNGLERYYDPILSGTSGRRLSVVNAVGHEMESWIAEDPLIGSKVRLTLDLELQKAVEESMADLTGATVVLDVNTGAVLAFTSRPSFDPNIFSGRVSKEQWKLLTDAPDDPLHNRASLSKYSPGSTFKILEALAALEEGVITPSTSFHCTGGTRIHGQYRRCWKAGGHGTVDLKQAIQGSCNVYFYKVGDLLGIERIARWARAFGYGAKTGLDLPVESPGTVPDPAWKKRVYKQPWWPGETISVAIGQGALEVTTLQQAVFAAAVANGGSIWRPYILDAVEDPGRPDRIMQNQPTLIRRVVMQDRWLEEVRHGMWMVVNQAGGTARRASVEGMDVCGKTGTAQVHRGSAGVDNKDMARELRDHAWFIGYAPRHNPEIAWAVFVEHGGHGGDTAAPVARRIVETWVQGSSHPEPVGLQASAATGTD